MSRATTTWRALQPALRSPTTTSHQTRSFSRVLQACQRPAPACARLPRSGQLQQARTYKTVEQAKSSYKFGVCAPPPPPIAREPFARAWLTNDL
ncbi:hypothetical protein IMZ48_04390 [Candidatus Bathyarchaeota archaeon]|nr:hypothetical protein [Candidatus Bathyarchaeota archaeon]